MIKGRKRHLLVDTQGLLLHGVVTTADVQPSDGGLKLLTTVFGLYRVIQKLFADSACRGPIFPGALTLGALAGILPRLEAGIVKRSDRARGFLVERTIAWLNRCRRLAKDRENLNRSALAFLKLASIRLMRRKPRNPS